MLVILYHLWRVWLRKNLYFCLSDITNCRRELFIAIIQLFVLVSTQNKQDCWTLKLTNASICGRKRFFVVATYMLHKRS